MKGASARHSRCCLRTGTSTFRSRQLGKASGPEDQEPPPEHPGRRLFRLPGQLNSFIGVWLSGYSAGLQNRFYGGSSPSAPATRTNARAADLGT